MEKSQAVSAYAEIAAQTLDFDDIVAVAAAICGTETSVVTLIQEGRQWLLNANMDVDIEVPAEQSFCSRTILQDQLLEVKDAREDPRFCKSPLVDKEDGTRFYAGVPFSRADGSRMGALCVFDQQPKALTDLQRKTLTVLARQITARFREAEHRQKLELAMQEAEKARHELQASERRFKAFINAGPFLAYLKDSDGRMVYYNERLAAIAEPKVGNMLGKTDAELWSAEAAAMYRKNDLEVLGSGQAQVREEDSLSPDGTRTFWKSYKFPFEDEQGNMHLGGVSLNVTSERAREEELRRLHEELQAANAQLQELAMTDALTGLCNRRSFDLKLREEIAEARSTGKPLTVLMLDVDYFKRHNDLYGHAAGDGVLRALAHVLTTVVRKQDTLGRLGGEEFAVVLPNSDEESGDTLASRILRAVHAYPWENAPVTVSAGIAWHVRVRWSL